MSENQRIEFGHLPVEERIKSFRDFTIPLNDDEVHAQSLRCLHCGTPFCSNNCPLHNRPVDWNRLVREGDWERAWACLSATNSFPEFTSRVCPAICEAGCTRYLLDDAAVGIRSIERAVIDRAWREGWVRPEPAAVRTGRRVAVVGSGPAGLACAQQLARAGHDVTVYEKSERPGGLLRFGIPGLMLDPYVFVNEPWAVIAVMLIIMCITSSVTAALVLLLGWPLDTALVMGACVSQLGEFSFILCGQGIALGIATSGTMSIVVAASILTIALNPLMFTAIPHVRNLLVSRRPFFARMAERVSPLASVEPKTIKGHVLIAGVNEVVLALLPRLEARGIDFTCFVMSDTTAAVVDSYKHGSAIVGNPSDPALLVQGHLVDAEVLVLPSSDMVLNKTVFAAARELKHDCRIIVRVANPENLRAVPSDEHTRILNDTQIASESLGEAVADVFGIGAQVRHEKAVARGEATNDVDEDEGAAIIAQARAEAAASAARHAARNTSRRSIFDGIREKMAKRREEKARAKAAVKAAQATQAAEGGEAADAAFDASAVPEAQKPSFFSGMKDKIVGLRVKQRIADLKVKEKIADLNVKEKLDNLNVKERIENLDVKGRIERLDVKGRIENLNLKDKMDKIKGVDYKKWMPSFGKSAAAGAAGAAAAEAAQTAEAAEKAETAEAAQPVQAESAAPAAAPVDIQPEVVQPESAVEEERTTEVQAAVVSEPSVKDVPASDAPADAPAEAASEEAKPAVTDDVKKTEQ